MQRVHCLCILSVTLLLWLHHLPPPPYLRNHIYIKVSRRKCQRKDQATPLTHTHTKGTKSIRRDGVLFCTTLNLDRLNEKKREKKKKGKKQKQKTITIVIVIARARKHTQYNRRLCNVSIHQLVQCNTLNQPSKVVPLFLSNKRRHQSGSAKRKYENK